MAWLRAHLVGLSLGALVLLLISVAAVLNVSLLSAQDRDDVVGNLSPVIEQSRVASATKDVPATPADEQARAKKLAAEKAARAKAAKEREERAAAAAADSSPVATPVRRPAPVVDDHGGDRPRGSDDSSGSGGGDHDSDDD